MHHIHPAPPWHISHVRVTVQIIVLCCGCYNQHHDHYNASRVEVALARDLHDLDVHPFPILEWPRPIFATNFTLQ